MDWTVDHGLDRGLDYAPNSVGPPHAYIAISFSPCARTFFYVDLTAKLALPCQLLPRPFEILLAQYASAFMGVALRRTSHLTGVSHQCRMLSRKSERTVSVV